MKPAALHKKLMAAARAARPSDHVPYAFEKRIMARLRGNATLDALGHWTRALWRAAVPCFAITLCIAGWALWEGASLTQGNDFPEEFETAVLLLPPAYDETW